MGGDWAPVLHVWHLRFAIWVPLGRRLPQAPRAILPPPLLQHGLRALARRAGRGAPAVAAAGLPRGQPLHFATPGGGAAAGGGDAPASGGRAAAGGLCRTRHRASATGRGQRRTTAARRAATRGAPRLRVAANTAVFCVVHSLVRQQPGIPCVVTQHPGRRPTCLTGPVKYRPSPFRRRLSPYPPAREATDGRPVLQCTSRPWAAV